MTTATAQASPNIACIKYRLAKLDCTNCMRHGVGQALQLALLFVQTSAVLLGNLGLPFEINLDQEAVILLTPGQ